MEIKKSTLWKGLAFLLVLAIIITIVILGGKGDSTSSTGFVVKPVEGSTFMDNGNEILTDNDGKPYVILFSTTWCPHCKWIKETFDSLKNESFSDKINLQHWELDTGDNTLTPEIETEVPPQILSIYKKYNPEGSIPTFVFGGRYIRIGNGYERQNDLNAEMEDFKLIISKLIE